MLCLNSFSEMGKDWTRFSNEVEPIVKPAREGDVLDVRLRWRSGLYRTFGMLPKVSCGLNGMGWSSMLSNDGACV